MGKVVVLKLDGDLEIGGFLASLEIKESNRVLIEIRGVLPPNPELAAEMQCHWLGYRNLGLASRISPVLLNIILSPALLTTINSLLASKKFANRENNLAIS